MQTLPMQDETAVIALMIQLVEAWNQHDAHTYATLFTETSDFVNVMGLWMQGRSAIEQGHTQVFSTFLGKSYLTLKDTQVKWLNPDIAVLHCAWEIEGQQSPDRIHALQNTGIWTAIALREVDAWKIAALHNTGRIPLANSH